MSPLIIPASGATQTVHFRQITPTIEWTIDDTTWTPIASDQWPVSIQNTTPPDTLKILFKTDITISDPSQYFVIAGSDSQPGNTSLNDDGSITRFTINGVSNYPGLINNGTNSSAGGTFTYVFNLEVDVSGSTLATGGGWIGQAYFGSGLGTGDRKSWVVNCKSNGPISQNAGGILGASAGYEDGFVYVIGCSSSGDIDNSAGGIVGYQAGEATSGIQYVNISSCWSSGNINGVNAGGILGANSLLISVSSSYSSGSINGTNAGGIIGSGSTSVSVSNCYSTGNISGNGASGISGGVPLNTLVIQNCYSSGSISAVSGGIVGGASDTTLSNCYTSGAGTGTGGIIASSSIDPPTCYSEANNGTAGWNAANANNVLTGVTSGSWTIVGTGPYLITMMGYTPYAQMNIVVDVSGDAMLNRSFSATIPAGGTTTGPTYLPGYTYAITQITPASLGIIINAGSGALSASISTTPAVYTVWVYASINPYSITPFYLTVSAGPPQPAIVPWIYRPFPAVVFPQRPNSWYLMARTAWDTYERVQTTDADTRVQLSGTGWAPPSWRNQSLTIWYVFQSSEEKNHFNLGQRLHQQAYPQLNWIAQRNLGISESVVSVSWPQPL